VRETLETINAKPVDKVIIVAKLKAICPITKTIDNYQLTIEYIPDDGKYIELKSLREYLDSFDGKEIFHEDLANELATTIYRTIKPKSLTLKLESEYLGMHITIIKTLEKERGNNNN